MLQLRGVKPGGGWRVEGGGVAAGNERQIHQTKEVWEFKRQKERDL